MQGFELMKPEISPFISHKDIIFQTQSEYFIINAKTTDWDGSFPQSCLISYFDTFSIFTLFLSIIFLVVGKRGSPYKFRDSRLCIKCINNASHFLLFIFILSVQWWHIRNVSQSCEGFRSSSVHQLLDLPLGVLGGTHRRRTGGCCSGQVKRIHLELDHMSGGKKTPKSLCDFFLFQTLPWR